MNLLPLCSFPSIKFSFNFKDENISKVTSLHILAQKYWTVVSETSLCTNTYTVASLTWNYPTVIRTQYWEDNNDSLTYTDRFKCSSRCRGMQCHVRTESADWPVHLQHDILWFMMLWHSTYRMMHDTKWCMKSAEVNVHLEWHWQIYPCISLRVQQQLRNIVCTDTELAMAKKYYTQLLSTFISALSLDHHLYADDTQLFFSFHPLNFDSSISHLQNTLQHISSWMTANRLTLNSSKTAFS